jgi:hypothetical protein
MQNCYDEVILRKKLFKRDLNKVINGISQDEANSS